MFDKFQRFRRIWDSEGFGGRFGFGRHGGGGPFGFGRHGGPGGPGGRGRGGRFFEHGGLKLVVLALIAERPRHGYEIIKDIEERMGGAYAPSAGVVYPTLTLLEETGQIEVASSEGNKKLYRVTDAGRASLEGNRAQVDAMLARMTETGAARRGDRDPRLVRAVENLRLALRLKLSSGPLSDGEISALVKVLDDTASYVEKL